MGLNSPIFNGWISQSNSRPKRLLESKIAQHISLSEEFRGKYDRPNIETVDAVSTLSHVNLAANVDRVPVRIVAVVGDQKKTPSIAVFTVPLPGVNQHCLPSVACRTAWMQNQNQGSTLRQKSAPDWSRRSKDVDGVRVKVGFPLVLPITFHLYMPCWSFSMLDDRWWPHCGR